MERNWLIRTTQNQILGPIAKEKVLEFLQKNALGLNDEVASGNGYWFSIKEKDLVDKYLYGDVPQSFNPVSEAKSILAKRENPNRTNSINTTPIDNTQIFKIEKSEDQTLPNNDDLEYPDNTLVFLTKNLNVSFSAPEETKLPTTDDLEFPDISLIREVVNNSPIIDKKVEVSIVLKSQPEKKEEAVQKDAPVIYPEDNDLDYPDMESTGKTLTSHPLELEVKAAVEVVVKSVPAQSFKLGMKKDKNSEVLLGNSEDKILLHERKTKASSQISSSIEAVKAPGKERTPLPENLKKRNDNYLLYVLVFLVLIIVSLLFYYYNSILNKPLSV